MLRTKSSCEDHFIVPTDSHDIFSNQDHFLNLADETQTQAGSLEFNGSSAYGDSLSSIGNPSPVVNATQMNFSGTSYPHMPDSGFAVLPPGVNNNMVSFNTLPTWNGHFHFPGCPSTRSGVHQHQAMPMQQSMSQQTNPAVTCNPATPAWTMQNIPGTESQAMQYTPQEMHAPSYGLHNLAIHTGQLEQQQDRRPSSNFQQEQQSHAPSVGSESVSHHSPQPQVQFERSQRAPSLQSRTPIGGAQSQNENAVVYEDVEDQGRTSPVSTVGSAATQDNEGGPGRRSRLYQATPSKEDGLYHCYFEGRQDCTHEPTKLKCNYDKFIDSHLKPYRCKHPDCGELRFSSTACRLRHEREAHGSHGHGVNPYLCHYKDCDRSKPDKGFPRAWNCNDHMKRCHGYVPSAKDEQMASAAAAAQKEEDQMEAPPSPKQAPRKRSNKDTDTSGNPPSKKQKTQGRRGRQPSAVENQESAMDTLARQERLHNEWRQRRKELQMLIQHLGGPSDGAALHRVQSEVAAMVAINQELNG